MIERLKHRVQSLSLSSILKHSAICVLNDIPFKYLEHLDYYNIKELNDKIIFLWSPSDTIVISCVISDSTLLLTDNKNSVLYDLKQDWLTPFCQSLNNTI